jgi:hypothetical protein
MHYKLVGFTGAAGCGKSTAASVFVMHEYEELPFARPLKDMLRVILVARGCPDPDAYLHGNKKEVLTPYLMGKSARHAMQTLGTEWGRNSIHNELWVNTWFVMAKKELDAGGRVVVADVRFQNEADAIKRLGGHVVEITRPAHLKLMGDTAQHGSEYGGILADRRIENDGVNIAGWKCKIEGIFF